MTNTVDRPQYVYPSQAARAFRIPRRVLDAMIANGTVGTIKVSGARTVIRLVDLERAIRTVEIPAIS